MTRETIERLVRDANTVSARLANGSTMSSRGERELVAEILKGLAGVASNALANKPLHSKS